jgi:flagellar basal-body rod protein FlgG
MNGAFQIAAVGLEAQQRALDTIANNISNVNTPGFKRSNMRFSEILASRPTESVRADLGQSLITTAGVQSDALFMLDEQGRLEATGRAMDLAIDGSGFIELLGAEGQSLLWRGGTLKLGEDGQLSTLDGIALKAGVSVPADATDIAISADGVVKAFTADSADGIEIGQIALVRIENPETVERLDGGYYRAGADTRVVDSRPGEDGAGRLVQGSIERSTVELTSEMVQLMLVQRAYAANAQLIQAADQLMALANGLRR